MHTKRLKAFVNFWVVFWYLYVPPLKQNGFTMFWELCQSCVTDSFSELTFLWFSFYVQWLTQPYLCFIWTVVNDVLVCFQFEQQMADWICSFFSIYSVSSNPWCFILYDGEADTPQYFVIAFPDCVLDSSFSALVPWD